MAPAPLPRTRQTAASRNSPAASVSASGRLYSRRTRRWWYMWRTDGDTAEAGAIERKPVEGDYFYCSVSCYLFTLILHRCLSFTHPYPQFSHPPRRGVSGGTAVKAGVSHGRYGCGRTAVEERPHQSAYMSRIIWVCTTVGLLTTMNRRGSTATKHSRGGLSERGELWIVSECCVFLICITLESCCLSSKHQ